MTTPPSPSDSLQALEEALRLEHVAAARQQAVDAAFAQMSAAVFEYQRTRTVGGTFPEEFYREQVRTAIKELTYAMLLLGRASYVHLGVQESEEQGQEAVGMMMRKLFTF
jgi:hypothetical protein